MHCLKKLYWGLSNRTVLKLTKNYKSDFFGQPVTGVNTRCEPPVLHKNIDKFLEEQVSEKSTNWDVVRETFKNEMKSENMNRFILMKCTQMKAFDKALDFYRYLLKKDENLGLRELIFILNILAARTDISDQADIVHNLYDKFKPLIESHIVLQKPALVVFSRFQHLYEDIIKSNFNLSHHGLLIAKAFDYDNKDLGFKLFSKNCTYTQRIVVIAFFNFCIRRAKENNFDVSDLDRFVSICEENLTQLPTLDLLSFLESLVGVLNSNKPNNFLWHVNETEISRSGVCTTCHNQLRNQTISAKEFETLKKVVFNDLFFGKSVILRASQEELKSYTKFLQRCSPYDLVVDGTNFFYALKGKEVLMNRVLDKLKFKRKRILIIARKHLITNRTFALFQSESQVFWTENDSDDDVFIIYAALSRGLKTYFLSKDLFREYNSYFSDKPIIKNLFMKWKFNHLYTVKGLNIVPASKYLCTPQKTVNEPSGLGVWHFPLVSESADKDCGKSVEKWICLERNPVGLNTNESIKNSKSHRTDTSFTEKLKTNPKQIDTRDLGRICDREKNPLNLLNKILSDHKTNKQ